MSEEEVLKLWKNGIGKVKIAEIYKKRFNQNIKTIRSNSQYRRAGRFISSYEALKYIETLIYRYVMLENKGKSYSKS